MRESDDAGRLQLAAETAVEQLAATTGLPAVFAAELIGSDLVVIAVADRAGALAPGTELHWVGVPDGSATATQDVDAHLLVAGRGEPLPTPAYVRAPVDGPGLALLAAFATEPINGDLSAGLALARQLASLLGHVGGLAAELADERERARMAEAESLFDPLTGLGNRRHWGRVLETEDSRCRRHGLPASVIVVDLDALKEINDASGHATGDDMLRRTGGVLREISRNHDAIARLGGDEFGLLAVDCGHEAAEILAERVRAALIDEDISASIGFAGRHPSGGLEHAWRRADTAMYADKRRRTEAVVDLTDAARFNG